MSMRFYRLSPDNPKNLIFVLTLLAMIVLLAVSGCRSVPAPKVSQASDRDEAWEQDIEYLKEDFPKYNKSFTSDSLAEFHMILDRTYRDIPSLSDNEIYVYIMRAVAAAKDGHTSVNMMPSAQKLRRLPIRFYWFSDGLYVIKAAAAHSELLGLRIAGINGIDPENLVRQLSEIVPGSNTSVRYESAYLLSSPDFLAGMGAAENPDMVSILFERPDGTFLTVDLPAMPIGEKIYGYQSWRELSPLSTVSQDAENMVHILDDRALPAYISSPNKSCYYKFYEDKKTLYVQVNQNTNLGLKVSDFTKEIETQFSGQNVDAGGGGIYIITGGPTFSAGIVTAARLKYYAGDRAVITGEPASEGLQFWAETRLFTLPNSNILIFAGHAYHNWENGIYDPEKNHFWLMKKVGVPARDIDIDLPVSVSFDDYLEGRDTVVEAVLESVF
jgi:hypothetical protein